MGSMMIPVGIELTCYYYSFLFATTFLYSRRKEAGAIMLGVTAATGFIDWAPTKYLPSTGPLANFRISQWLDEQYMLMSVVTLVGFVWIMYAGCVGRRCRSRRGGRGRRAERRSADAPRPRAAATSAADATNGRGRKCRAVTCAVARSSESPK